MAKSTFFVVGWRIDGEEVLDWMQGESPQYAILEFIKVHGNCSNVFMVDEVAYVGGYNDYDALYYVSKSIPAE